MPWPAQSRWRWGGCLLSTYNPDPVSMLGWVLAFAGTSKSASQSCGSTSQSLMRHVLHAGGVSGAADHARQPQFDLPGGRGDNATHRQRALADLAPARQFAFGVRPLGLELLDRGERLLAHVHGVDRLCGLDDVVEYHLDFLGLALIGPFQHRQQIGIAHRIAGERELGGATGGETVDIVLVIGERQKLDDALNRYVAAGGEIIAP